MATTKGTLLVTGAAGFVGGHAVPLLREAGYQVVSVVRKESRTSPSSAGRPSDRYSCDLTVSSEVRRMVRELRPNAVLHLAGRNHAGDSWADPAGYLESNLMATVYLLEALRQESPDTRIIVAGSMLSVPLGERPQPPHPYSLSKSLQTLITQSWAHLYRSDALVVRPSNLVGPGPSGGICTRLGAWIADREQGADTSFRLASLAEPRDYLDVRDAAAAIRILFEKGKPGHVYPVASGVYRSLGEVLNAFQAQSTEAFAVETPQELVGTGSSAIPADTPVAALHARALRVFGWQPQISFAQSVADILFEQRSGKGVRVWEIS
ncbi:NAD-dependent epimerase/dehydratase family protein [Gorillibacterium sp. CAU 1737]|uniref:NAD-dependent epimerase/dehydratase family protein n=1 Tax=Gorillibacterium sp. CAU 1737 TaxID=3140362 RepID=UPI003260D077